jgi:hypothetical protein
MNHGEAKIASSDAKVWRGGEMNSRGNGTPPGPFLTPATEDGPGV